MPITPASEIKRHLVIPDLTIEPSFGCRLQCKQCCLEAPPGSPKLMKPRKLDAQLREIRNAFAIKFADFPYLHTTIDFTGRGNPLDHPKLHELTQIVKTHFPRAEVNSFWNLDGVPNESELVRRTGGLDWLILSFDAHHYAEHMKLLRAQNAKLSPRELKEKTLNEMMEKFQWAKNASKINGFKLGIKLTGTKKEARFFEEHPTYKEISQTIHPVIHFTSRSKRGSSRGKTSGYLKILHDCTVTQIMP